MTDAEIRQAIAEHEREIAVLRARLVLLHAKPEPAELQGLSDAELATLRTQTRDQIRDGTGEREALIAKYRAASDVLAARSARARVAAADSTPERRVQR